MQVTMVHVHVNPDKVQEFIRATQSNHEGTIKEPGNRRFDVLQSPEDPCYFVLYEAFASPEDVAAHKTTPHYLAWRDTVADWMEKPRKGIPWKGLFPSA